MGYIVVFGKEFTAFFTVKFCEQVSQSIAPAEEVVEMLVAEAYACVVGNGASVVHLADIGPEDGAEAHVAGSPVV